MSNVPTSHGQSQISAWSWGGGGGSGGEEEMFDV